MSRMSRMNRRPGIFLVAAVIFLSWWITREPTRVRYLTHIVSQARHLPSRYSV